MRLGELRVQLVRRLVRRVGTGTRHVGAALAAVMACASLLVAAAFSFSGPAAVSLTACHAVPGLQCGTVAVPLDRSGAIKGSIDLSFALYTPSGGAPAGTVVFFPDGPGQATILNPSALNATSISLVDAPSLFPRYRVLFVDMRGTGGSGVLRCDGHEAAIANVRSAPLNPNDVAACAAAIGPSHPLYSTRIAVDDLNAVREALGIDKLALWGNGYGTSLAMEYAYAFPRQVKWLLLDSPLQVGGDSAYGLPSLMAVPRVLRTLCRAGACRSVTKDVATDFVRLANRLGAHGRSGAWIDPHGHRVHSLVTGNDLIDLAIASGMSGAQLESWLPSAVRMGMTGNLTPLLRLVALLRPSWALVSPYLTQLDPVATLATGCEDVGSPWARTVTSIDAQQQALTQALDALPPSDYAPFGAYALREPATAIAANCVGWSQAPTVEQLNTAAAPNVPVLIFSGDLDLRSPLEQARRVAGRYGRARVVVVHGRGSSLVDPGDCTGPIVSAWLANARFPGGCTSVSPSNSGVIVPVFPRRIGLLPVLRGVPVLAGRVTEALLLTTGEAHTTVAALSGGVPIGGLVSGVFTASAGIHYFNYSDVRGLVISGAGCSLTLIGPGFRGSVREQNGVLRLVLNGVHYAVTSRQRSLFEGGSAFYQNIDCG